MQILEQLASKNVNKWTINPTKEINGLKFGSDRDIVRKKFGEPKKSSKNQNTEKTPLMITAIFTYFITKTMNLKPLRYSPVKCH